MLPGEGRSLVGDPGSSPRSRSGPGALGRRRWPDAAQPLLGQGWLLV